MSGLIYPHKGLLMPWRVDLGGPIVTHLDSYGDGNKRFTFTATGMNFGPASAGRIIVVGIGARKDSLFGSWSGVTSCAIAGIAATLADANVHHAYGGIWYAVVPTGTSGTISWTTSGDDADYSGCDVWSIEDATSSAPEVVGNARNAGLTLSGLTLGAGIVCFNHCESTGGRTWSNAVERTDRTVSYGRLSGADLHADGSSETIEVTPHNGNWDGESLVCAAWY